MKNHYTSGIESLMMTIFSLISTTKQTGYSQVVQRFSAVVFAFGISAGVALGQCCPGGTSGMVETTTPLSPAAAGVENNDGGRDWNSTATTGATESVSFLILTSVNMETVTWTIAPFVVPAGARVCSVTDPTVTLSYPGALLTLSSSGISVTGSYTAGYTLTCNPSFVGIGLGSGDITVTVNAGSVVTQTGCPLPVELKDFSGKQEGRCAKLNWSTYSEKNNDYFTIQKLVDNRFVDIATVQSESGSTLMESNYEFTDCDVSPINYYRLSQTDKNGETVTIGELVSVEIDMEDPGQLMLVPNPAEDFACIYSDENLRTIRVVSMEGKVVSEETLSGDERQHCMTIDALPSGVYNVQIETPKGTATKKLLVR